MAKAMALGDIPTTMGVPGWLFGVPIGTNRFQWDSGFEERPVRQRL
jgi:hypothetical protein